MKRIICLVLVFCVFFSIAAFAFADTFPETKEQGSVLLDEGGTRVEETQWIIRRWNGLIQKRLWSITYGYWLTDWETIGYYDP